MYQSCLKCGTWQSTLNGNLKLLLGWNYAFPGLHIFYIHCTLCQHCAPPSQTNLVPSSDPVQPSPHSIIHLFNKLLLSTHYLLDSVLDAGGEQGRQCPIFMKLIADCKLFLCPCPQTKINTSILVLPLSI